jgi:hypothetical protein
MFNLSGAIEVLLLLIVRPRPLLICPPPEDFFRLKIELAPRSTSLAVSSDTYQHTLELTAMVLATGGSLHSIKHASAPDQAFNCGERRLSSDCIST